MIKRIHHIRFGVQNFEEARFFENISQLEPGQTPKFRELEFACLPLEGAHPELLHSTTLYGVIQKSIEKRGPGIHNVAREVNDIQAEGDRLKEHDVRLINENPCLNAHQKLVAFMHPGSTLAPDGVVGRFIRREIIE